MADEHQAPEPEETPVQDTPSEPDAQAPSEDTPEVNWQERYEHLQPEYTRATQRISQYEPVMEWYDQLNSEETQAEAIQRLANEVGPENVLKALGYEFEPDPNEPEPDPTAEMRQEWEQFKQQQAQQAQQAEVEQQAAALHREIAGKTEHLDLTDEERELVYLRSLAINEEGIDVDAAVKEFEDLIERRAKAGRSQWAASKRSSTPVQGREGIEQLSPDAPHGERVAAMTEQLLANGQ